ncbi:lysophospholipid acyltransferase 2 [Callorhinchus milii]|uniref:lysophospholipid acyltransferase 2 n=1 Tax=Callorhinchus milii TaxID=7868 RepID=UPI001C3FEE46|nr:lysophospholipid acyltransferase 2 [Callorhinchus milii]
MGSGVTGQFVPLSEKLHLPTEQVNFVVCQLFGLLTAFLFRKYLHPSKTSPIVRHTVATLLGLYFAFFCFGRFVVHFLLEVMLSYCVLVTIDVKRVHKYSFVAAMGYLTVCQIIRVYALDGKEHSADFSGPLMVITQKVTKLAFEIHDGLARDDVQLSPSQKRLAVRRVPSLLEYLSYNLNFMGILAGPAVSFNHYIDFIEGSKVEVKPVCPPGINSDNCQKHDPSPLSAVGRKVLSSSVSLLMHLTLLKTFPLAYNTDEEFVRTASFPRRCFYLYASLLACRPKYYFVWTMADAINNAAGFGFSGYDENGRARWDLTCNLNIMKIEFATSMKQFIDNWNIQTAAWLKEICYDRCSFSPTITTFFLSAVWHGVYPGYYLTFITGSFMTLASRSVRKNLRPHFLVSRRRRCLYDMVTWATTQLMVSYTVAPFVLLFADSSLAFYRSWYFCFHILTGVLVLVLPQKPRQTERKEQVESKEQAESEEQTERKGSSPTCLLNGHWERNGRTITDANRNQTREGKTII